MRYVGILPNGHAHPVSLSFTVETRAPVVIGQSMRQRHIRWFPLGILRITKTKTSWIKCGPAFGWVESRLSSTWTTLELW